MISSNKNKVIALGLALSLTFLTACGTKQPDKKSAAWNKKEQDRISRMWLPPRSDVCQNFVTIFTTFNLLISQRMGSKTKAEAENTVKQYTSFIAEADMVLTAVIAQSKEKDLKDYAIRFKKFILGLADSKNFSKEKASALMTEAKELIYNPPVDCKNP